MYGTARSRPKTSGRFASLMELYETNYMLIRLLVPGLQGLEDPLYVSQPPGVMALELSQIEHSRYTSTFNLSYRFSAALRHEREPDLAIRIYNDARTCEVMSGLIPTDRQEIRRVRNLMDGYRLNRFLQKWVSYCLRQGHSFDSLSQPQSKNITVGYPIL